MYTNVKSKYYAIVITVLILVLSVSLIFCFSSLSSETASAGDYFTGAKYTRIDTPMFNENGTVNASAVTQLQNILTAVKNGVGNKTNYSAEDFGKYADGVMNSSDQLGIILVRLFPQNTDFTGLSTLTSQNTAEELKAATNEYWQLVYTTNSSGQMVCTLYMANPYSTSKFQPSKDYVGNYSKSIIRNKVNDLYTQLSNKFTILKTAAVGAQPWQSGTYQTANDNFNGKAGSSKLEYGLRDTNNYYASVNGMYDNEIPVNSWNSYTAGGSNVLEDMNSDKMWLPSNFEMVYEGKQNGNASGLTDDYKPSAIDYPSTDVGHNASPLTNTNRSGLWRMNGYDRGLNSTDFGFDSVFLRSAFNSNEAFIPGYVFQMDERGRTWFGNTTTEYGVRPAMHLNLSSLNVEVTANANGGTIPATEGWTLAEGSASASKTMDLGAEYGVLPEPTRTGYTFNGWYSKNGTATNDWGTKIEATSIIDAVSPVTTLYAKWTANTYDVTYNLSLGTWNGTAGAGSYTYGAGLTLPTNLTRTGYTFAGWYDNEKYSGTAITAISATDIGVKNYYAKWTLDAPIVSISTDAFSIPYDGNAHTFTASASHASSQIMYSYQWYKQNASGAAVAVSGATNSTYSISSVSGSGNYSVKVTASDGNQTASATSEAKTFAVTKATNAWTTEYAREGWVYNTNPTTEIKPAEKFGKPYIKYYTDEACTQEFTGRFAKTTNAGTYYVKVTVPETADYTGLDKKYSFVISKATYDMSAAKWSDTVNFVYDESEKFVTVSGLPSGVTVKTYSNNTATNVGNYTASVTFNYDTVNYNEPTLANCNWSITQATNAWITEFARNGWVYNGNPTTETAPVATFGSPDVKYYTDEACTQEFVGTFTNTTNAGTYYAKATVAATDNYTGLENNYSFAISKASYDMSAAKWSDTVNFVYDESEKFVTVSGLPSGVTVKTYSNNTATNVGNYTASVTFNYDTVNYNEPTLANCNWSITQATNAWITEFAREGWVYNNNPSAVTAPVSAFGSPVFKYYTDAACLNEITEFTNTTPAGTYYSKVSVEGTADYTGLEKIYSFTIRQAVNYWITEYAREGWVYNTDPTSIIKPAAAYGTPAIKYYTDADCTEEFTGEFTSATPAGIYYAKVTVDATNDYSGLDKVYSFTVSKNLNEWTTEFAREGWVYNTNPTAIVDPAAKFGIPVIKYYTDEACTLEYTDGFAKSTNAGTYYVKVTVAGTEDYAGLVKNYSFTISKATYDMSAAKWSDAVNFVYDESEKSVTVTGLPSGVTIKAYNDNSATNVGNYTASVTFNYDTVNYNAPTLANCNWSITQATNAWTTEFARNGWVYNGNPTTETAPVATFGSPDLKYYTDEACTKEFTGTFTNTTNAGTYYVKATVAATNNYTGLENNYSFVISKATYDMSGAKWSDTVNFVYDESEKFVTVSGLPSGVTIKAYNDNSATNVGNYTASVTFNYDTVNYNEPTLANCNWSITQAINAWITEFAREGWVYNTNPTVIVDPTAKFGIPLIKYYTDEACTNEFTGTFTNTTNAGTYYVKVTVAETNNYAELNKRYQFTISKAVYDMIGVRFEDATLLENGEDLGLSVSGSLPEGVRAEYINNAHSEPGRYTVTVKFIGDAENYLPIPDMSAVLTVNRREISGGNESNDEIIVTEPEQGFDPDYNVNIYDVTEHNPDLNVGGGKNTEKVVEVIISKGDEIINPDRIVTVRILLNDLSGKNLLLYRLNSDGSLEAVDAVRDGDYLNFQTDEMGKFAIASESEQPPKTDDKLGLKIGLPIGGIILLALIITVIVVSKKKKKKGVI